MNATLLLHYNMGCKKAAQNVEGDIAKMFLKRTGHQYSHTENWSKYENSMGKLKALIGK